MRDDGMNCKTIQRAMRDGRGLAEAETAHVDECEGCTDAWLTLALDTKPEVTVPENFAARVAAMASAGSEKRRTARMPRHWGVISAMAFVTVMLVVCFAGPKPDTSWVSIVFVMLVASEIAGLALWLGPRWLGR